MSLLRLALAGAFFNTSTTWEDSSILQLRAKGDRETPEKGNALGPPCLTLEGKEVQWSLSRITPKLAPFSSCSDQNLQNQP